MCIAYTEPFNALKYSYGIGKQNKCNCSHQSPKSISGKKASLNLWCLICAMLYEHERKITNATNLFRVADQKREKVAKVKETM